MKGLNRFIGLPLGMEALCGAMNPQWLLGAASLALGVAGSIFGAAKARNDNVKRKEALAKKERKEKAWYDKAYNTDYLDTKAGQNVLRRAQEVQDNYIRKADGAAAIGGGTVASSAMAKEAANRTMGNAIANIGAQDTARKQQVEDQHNQNVMSFEDQRAGLAKEAAANTTTAAQNMSNALMSSAALLEGGGNKSTTTSTPTETSTPSGAGVTDAYFKQDLLNKATGLMK